MNNLAMRGSHRDLPKWVPLAAKHYLAHTEDGLSIRALARATDCHPSTILRQVRRFEGRRDDPLIDAALKALADQSRADAVKVRKTTTPLADTDERLTQERIDQDAKRILRRLCEPRAVLAVAREMETAVVVRENDEGESLRTAIVDREIAQAMALKSWIACPDDAGRIRRYFITNAGRAALRRLTAADENRAQGFGDITTDGALASWAFPKEMDGMRSRARYYATESPLLGLARRKDRDGTPFLDADLVKAGERLREDFELAQIGGPAALTCEAFLNTPEDIDDVDHVPPAARAARARVRARMCTRKLVRACGSMRALCVSVYVHECMRDWNSTSRNSSH